MKFSFVELSAEYNSLVRNGKFVSTFYENKISGNNQHTWGIVSENRKYELDEGECIFKNN
jgi:hypothetical protein